MKVKHDLQPSNSEILDHLAARLKLSQEEQEQVKKELMLDAQRVKAGVNKLASQCDISVSKALSAVLQSAPPRSIKDILATIKPQVELNLHEFFNSIPGWKRRRFQLTPSLKIVHIGNDDDPISTYVSSSLSKCSIKSFKPSELDGFEQFVKSEHVDLVIVSSPRMFSPGSRKRINQEPFAHWVCLVETNESGVRDRRTSVLPKTAKPSELSKALVSASVRTKSETVEWLMAKRPSITPHAKKLPPHLKTLGDVIMYHSKSCEEMNSSVKKCYSDLSKGIGRKVFYEGLIGHFGEMSRHKVEIVGELFPELGRQIIVSYNGEGRRFAINGSQEFISNMTVERLPQKLAIESHIDPTAKYYHANPFDLDDIHES